MRYSPTEGFYKRIVKSLLFVGVLFPAFLVSSYTIQAVEYGGIGGRPAYPRKDNPRTESIFVHTANPGDSISEGVKILNNTAEEKTILIYAVDSLVSSGGAFSCKQQGESKEDAGAWINLSKTEVTLNSLSEEIIPFSILVPGGTSVGEHNGCIVIQEKKDASSVANQGGVILSFRSALRVAILVPGEITRKLEVQSFNLQHTDKGSVNFKPQVKNLGNVSIDADVKVKTDYFFGAKLSELGGQFPILRGEVSDWNFELQKPFWGGFYKSTLYVQYDESSRATIGVQSGEMAKTLSSEPVWFFSMPTTKALIIELVAIALVLCALAAFVLSFRKHSFIKNNWVSYTVSGGEDLNSIADKFNVTWSLLAKVNKIKPPYAVRSGQRIQVPPKQNR